LFSGSQLAVLRLRARETLEAFRREGGNTEFPNARLVVGETGLEMQPKEFLGLRGAFVVIEAVFSHIFYAAIETKLMYSEQLPVLEKPKCFLALPLHSHPSWNDPREATTWLQSSLKPTTLSVNNELRSL
jgi:hypothetical protein